MIIEENILLTFSLGPQSYHTECCTLNMYYKMQLITVIYCLNLFKSLLDQPLAADLSLVMFIFAILFLRVTAVMLNWIKFEQVQHLR